MAEVLLLFLPVLAANICFIHWGIFWWSESERACIEVYFFLFAHSYSAKENFISILLLYT